MTYTVELIEHTNPTKLYNYLSLLHYLEVYEPNGSLKNTIASKLTYFDRKGKFSLRFNLAIAKNAHGSIVGYALYYPKDHGVKFYVLPTWRDKGVGKALVDAVRTWSKYSTLNGYTGFGNWESFFKKNFILNREEYERVSRADAVEYGGVRIAQKAILKAAKLKLSRELRLVMDI